MYSTGAKDAKDLSKKLEKQYEVISEYMSANKLVLNNEKLMSLYLEREAKMMKGKKLVSKLEMITLSHQHQKGYLERKFVKILNGKNILLKMRSP